MPEIIVEDLPNAKSNIGLEDVPRETTQPKVDTKPEVPSADPNAPPPQKDASRFAALAKKEKGLVLKTNDLKMKEAKVAEKENALIQREVKLTEFENLKRDFATNPLKALEYLGISYKELTDYILQGEKPTPELVAKSVDSKLSAWEKRLEDKEKAAEEAQRKAAEAAKLSAEQEHTQAWQEWTGQIVEFVKSNPDKYELINLNEAAHLVVATIQEHYEKSVAESRLNGQKPKVLSHEAAADLVEKFLEDRVKANQAAKKFQTQPAAKGTPDPKQVEKPSKEAPQRTLTNTMTSSAPSLLPAKTERERIERAMAALSKAG